LKAIAGNLNIKTSITVGIIGYPNVGKSSLINSLKRAKVVGVAATPGFTKTAQEIHLDKNVKLLDCPGIVFSNTGTEADIILRNCVKVDQIEDPTVPVEVIIRRCRRDQLQELYCIPEFKDSGEFLSFVAQKKGKLKKGGIPDYKTTAKIILNDWNSGKIPFYTVPPERTGVHIGASIVSTWGDIFDINNVIKQEKTSVLASLTNGTSGTFMELEPGKNMDESQFINNLDKVDADNMSDISEDGNMEDDGDEGEESEEEVEDMEEEEQEEKAILRPIKKVI